MPRDCPFHDRLHPDERCTCAPRERTPDWSIDDWVRYREAKQRQVAVLQADNAALRDAIRSRDKCLVELVRAVDAFVAWWGSDGWSVTLLQMRGAAQRARSEIET